jgi:hypothetical protein
LKLKEYWPSWREAQRLKSLPLVALQAPRANALPVLVSLTSIPSRLHVLPLTIRSLLSQRRPAQKILLWLHHSLAASLPTALTELQSEMFEIHFVDLTCSHRKLIHALAAFPDQTIVTCDDDLMYAPDWLEQLFEQHLLAPKAIVANACRQISRDTEGRLLPYKQWPYLKIGQASDLPLLPIGYAGVLYPPEALDKRTTDVPLFLKLAPKADDLWFRAMAHLQGTPIRHASSTSAAPVPIIGSQSVSLLKSNVREDGNRVQWQALCDYFNIH